MAKTDGLRDWLERSGVTPTPVDPAAVAEYERSWREDCWPKIEAALKRQARAAHKARQIVLF